MAVLKAYDLVDDATLDLIDDGFQKCLGKKDAGDAGNAWQRAVKNVKKGRQQATLGARQVFEALVKQKRVRHLPRNASEAERQAVPSGSVAMDLTDIDEGYKQWYKHQWTPEVRKRNGGKGGYEPLPKPVPLPPQRSAGGNKPIAPNSLRKGNPFIFDPNNVDPDEFVA